MRLMAGSLDYGDSGCLCSLFPSLAGLSVFFSEMLASRYYCVPLNSPDCPLPPAMRSGQLFQN